MLLTLLCPVGAWLPAARVHLLPVQNLAKLVWGAAKQHTLLDIIGNDNDMDWMYSLSSVPSFLVDERGLLRLAVPWLCERMADLQPQHAPMVAYAYARVAPEIAHPLFEALARRASQPGYLQACDHKGQAILLWAFAKQGLYHEVRSSPLSLTLTVTVDSCFPRQARSDSAVQGAL